MHKSSLTIRQLVEDVFKSGDLKGGNLLIPLYRKAVRLLKKDFEDYPDISYGKDLSYEKTFKSANLDLTSSIDAYFDPENSSVKTPTILMVEITGANLEKFDGVSDFVSWGIARANAAILAIIDDLPKINVKIRWYHRDSMDFVEREEFYKKDELISYLDDLVAQYFEWNDSFASWPLVRDKSIADFDFPLLPYRKGQREMMAQVYRSIRDREHSMIEAPTGIGKTLATLFPAAKALGEGHCEKLFYLTARTTGRQIAIDALNLMQKKGLRLKYVEITSKEKTCFLKSDPKNCEECRYAKNYYDRVKDGLAKAFEYDDLNRERLEEIGEHFELCPFELSLDASLFSDCIICDYNYAFDPQVSLQRYFEEVDGKYVFLIDEAHNLIDRSRNMFSCDLNYRDIDSLHYTIEGLLVEETKALAKLLEQLDVLKNKVAKNYKTKREGLVLHEVPDGLMMAIKKAVRRLGEWIEQGDKPRFRKSVVEVYYRLENFMVLAEDFNEDYTLLCDLFGPDKNFLSINIFCINPSIKLSEAFKRSSASIMFSATLKPFDYFKEVLGFKEDCSKIALPSPFPSKNLRVEIALVNTTYKNREQTALDVVAALENMIKFKTGNYMVFFPSYKYMEAIFELFEQKNSGVNSFMQEPMMSEEERNEFIERFSVFSSSSNMDRITQLGFAVMGGVFSEGIDLVGEKLVGVAIVGVGMPGISIERNEIKNFYSKNQSNKYKGFEYSYTYPGITKVLQSAGRVIRSETDKGIVVLIDERFSKFPYKNLLPPHWDIQNS